MLRAFVSLVLVAVCLLQQSQGGRGRDPRHVPCLAVDTSGTQVLDEPCDFESEDPNEPSLFECAEPQRAPHYASDYSELHVCLPRRCEEDNECLGASRCSRFGQCSISRDLRKYAGACRVVEQDGVTVNKTRPCLPNSNCDTSRGRTITLDGRSLTAYKCRCESYSHGGYPRPTTPQRPVDP